MNRPRILACIALALAAALWMGQGTDFEATQGEEGTADSLAALGIQVTGGAAAGYVDDRLCARCHSDLARSYQEVGMARSFYRPRPKTDIEDFEQNRFVHERSGNIYEIKRTGERYVFKRFQEDAEGRPLNEFEVEIDWVLGSGSHSRTYLYQLENGEMYQLPLAWYTQNRSWGMAPGYDNAFHPGVLRPVRRECMFCHNAYPDVPAGSDVHGTPHTYPFDLPEGTGCQRCHGPGAEHVRISLGVDQPLELVRSSITNPGRLTPELQSDVCNSCHMQPSVALAGVRQFHRSDYSFRPGEPLSEYQVQIDVTEEGKERSERFEINHHPYRLEQSPCYLESAGALTCLTCHDPHRKVPPTEQPAHYRAACLSCHELDSCQVEAMANPALHDPQIDLQNCVACHMNERRTHDVVNVTMTDHFIRRRPGGPELLAPREESTPIITEVHLKDPVDGPQGAAAEVYRAVTVLRAGGGEDAVEHLEKMLASTDMDEIEPWLRLLSAQYLSHRFDRAEVTLGRLSDIAPDHPLATEWHGLVYGGLERYDEALVAMRKAAREHPQRPETQFILGRFLLATGQTSEAILHLKKATGLRTNFAAAWFYLGKARLAMRNADLALDSFRRCLELDPAHTPTYLAISEALRALDNHPEALRLLRHGLTASREPELIQPVIEGLLEEPQGNTPTGAEISTSTTATETTTSAKG